jgi:UDP-N-acetylglucosamine--N-acetylmuramyl-(pentapeptide) pyrophosphoryl-undecaprenol N-acetylglucosamine transferase
MATEGAYRQGREDDLEVMRVIIAGGGTGGHVYPGIAVAKEIMRRNSQAEVLFVGTEKGLESKVIPQEGFQLQTITISGVKGIRGLRRLGSLLKIPLSVWESFRIISQFKPRLVVGVGGYSSGPPVLVAALLRIPILLQEQNAIPGLTNRLLARFAGCVATSFPESQNFFGKKAVLTGNPVRREFRQSKADIPEDRFVIVIVGGSQGARAINQAVIQSLDYLKSEFGRLKFIHQTGESDYEEVSEAYARSAVAHEVRPFFYDMPSQYLRADLLISRAGATTLAEIALSGKASILIPFPHATDNHQQKNAESFASTGAAEMILQKALSGKLLADRIQFYLNHSEELQQMAERSLRFGRPDATERIVDLAMALASQVV